MLRRLLLPFAVLAIALAAAAGGNAATPKLTGEPGPGLTIEGHYAPPGGVGGRTADRMLLHTAARGTARWFLGHLATQLRGVAPDA